MARPLRIEYAHAVYHVFSRGNAQQEIFFDEKDRFYFLDHLAHMTQSHNVVCHSATLMDNHFHLLVETPDANLSRFMHHLNGGYSQRFNHLHGRVGHLFQGRFGAHVIEKETYLLELVRYLALNPVRAGLVKRPEDWPWGSFRALIGLEPTPEWLFADWILAQFGAKRSIAQRRFYNFVMDGLQSGDPYDQLAHGFLLGSPQFIHEMWECTNGSEVIKEHPRQERIVGRPGLQDIFEEVKTKEERNQAIVFAYARCGYFFSEIARHVKLDPSTIGKICKIPDSGPDPM